MTNKTLEQFMCDFFDKHDTIEVNCNWLQSILRNKQILNRNLESELKKASYQIEILKSKVMSMEMDMPQYKLDIKG